MSAFSYYISKLIEEKENKSLYHKLGVCGILLVLFFFKYMGLLNSVFTVVYSFFSSMPKFNINTILLPLGISYITFKHLSFITDVYWGTAKRGNFYDFLCYSSLFTIFTAGPIERYNHFYPQISTKNIKFSYSYFDEGFSRIVYGISKKVIADWIGYFINSLWGNFEMLPFNMRLLVMVSYSFQIYLDFAGYSDMAIGSSRFFGLTIIENFNNPYFQRNISLFWRNWHISLYSWLSDYIFYPIQMNFRNFGIYANIIGIFITFICCGLWHGASSHFLFWGLWHGTGMVIYTLWSFYKKNNEIIANIFDKPIFTYISYLVTFCFVTIGWWWFR
jgi:Predicted membrane protein involved in D-alanine export